MTIWQQSLECRNCCYLSSPPAPTYSTNYVALQCVRARWALKAIYTSKRGRISYFLLRHYKTVKILWLPEITSEQQCPWEDTQTQRCTCFWLTWIASFTYLPESHNLDLPLPFTFICISSSTIFLEKRLFHFLLCDWTHLPSLLSLKFSSSTLPYHTKFYVLTCHIS